MARVPQQKGYLQRAAVYKTPRFAPSDKQLEGLAFYQKSSGLLIPKVAFSRLVREVMQDVLGETNVGGPGYRIQSLALEVLQDSAEQIITHWFSCLNLSAIHAKRVTIQVRDSQFFRSLSQRVIANPVCLYHAKGGPRTRTSPAEGPASGNGSPIL